MRFVRLSHVVLGGWVRIAVSKLVAAIYPQEQRAVAVLASLQHEQIIAPLNLSDAVIVTRSKAGKVKLHRHVDQPGTVGYAFWQMLIGFLFFTPGVGLGGDSSTAMPWGTFSDYGIDAKFVQELTAQLTPGCSALFVLIWHPSPDGAMAAVSKYGGTVVQTGLGEAADTRLRAALT
jgi:uncharacterized membrane protein